MAYKKSTLTRAEGIMQAEGCGPNWLVYVLHARVFIIHARYETCLSPFAEIIHRTRVEAPKRFRYIEKGYTKLDDIIRYELINSKGEKVEVTFDLREEMRE